MIGSIIIIVLCVLLLIFFFKHLKILKSNALTMVTGGVKSGKSTLAVYLAVKYFKKTCRKVALLQFFRSFANFFRRKDKRKPDYEKPLLYSNIPLKVPHVLLTEDLLLRNHRFNYRSIIYIGEISLVSNSMNFSNSVMNEQQLLFYKLIGHSTRGGRVIIDTQCIQDCHYSIKRSISEYFYIHHTIKWIPFVLVMAVKECRYSEDNSVSSVDVEDVENTLKYIVVPKRVWKLFDCYCYSFLTDDLEVNRNVIQDYYNKFDIVSFNKYKKLYGGAINEKKNI